MSDYAKPFDRDVERAIEFENQTRADQLNQNALGRRSMLPRDNYDWDHILQLWDREEAKKVKPTK